MDVTFNIPKVFKAYRKVSNEPYHVICGYLNGSNQLIVPNSSEFFAKYNFAPPTIKYDTFFVVPIHTSTLCIETPFVDKKNNIIFTDDVLKVQFGNNYKIGRVVIEKGSLMIYFLSDTIHMGTDFLANIDSNNCEIIGNKNDDKFWIKLLINKDSWQGESNVNSKFIVTIQRYCPYYNLSYTDRTLGNFDTFEEVIKEVTQYIKDCQDDTILVTSEDTATLRKQLLKEFETSKKFGENMISCTFNHMDMEYTINIVFDIE